MIEHSFSTSQGKIFNACLTALNELNCNILESNISTGVIRADKSINIFTYGHTIEIHINPSSKTSIESRSKGIQLVDWGTNMEIETDILNNILRLVK